MRKKLLNSIGFIICFLAGLSFITAMLIRKPITDNTGFYEQEKNTIDVLYIGSSHTFCSISPLEIYQKYGITGYIRATSCQKSWDSYTLLQDSLKYQKPKIVAYEVMTAYHSDTQAEGFSREVYDTMRPSIEKYKGIKRTVENTEDDELSYLFPIIRYHERWKELGENDFKYFTSDEHIPYKGFMVSFDVAPAKDYNENMYMQDKGAAQISDKNRTYITKMKELCDREGIRFVMWKAPTVYEPYWDLSMSKGMKKFADELGVEYIDYNVGNTAIKIDWENETSDEGNHLNYNGAMKVTNEFGKWLAENYDWVDRRADEKYSSWDVNYAKYCEEINRQKLLLCDSFEEYMQILKESFYNNPNYVIMMASKDEEMNSLSEKHKMMLSEIGNTLNYDQDGSKKPNIYIARNGEKLCEIHTEENIYHSFYIEEHRVDITCLGYEQGNCCDILIDGSVCGKDSKGLNIVVYDLAQDMVLDSCYAKFTQKGDLKIYRK